MVPGGGDGSSGDGACLAPTWCMVSGCSSCAGLSCSSCSLVLLALVLWRRAVLVCRHHRCRCCHRCRHRCRPTPPPLPPTPSPHLPLLPTTPPLAPLAPLPPLPPLPPSSLTPLPSVFAPRPAPSPSHSPSHPRIHGERSALLPRSPPASGRL